MTLYCLLPKNLKKTGHYVIDSPDQSAHEEILSSPRILIIEEKHDGIFINRYMENGSWVGDTWHKTIEEAKHQAEFEFGVKTDAWEEVPIEVTDKFKYIFEQIK